MPPISRIFLGWNSPALQLAAEWLTARYRSGTDSLDLSRVIVALPIRRAGRRLVEILATRVGGVVPPRIVTLGELPEALYDSPDRIASELESLLCRMASLRLADQDLLADVFPAPPETGDVVAWMELARELEDLRSSLAAARLDFASAREGLIAKMPRFPMTKCWLALDALQKNHEHMLALHGLREIHSARETAIESGNFRTEREVVLLGCSDFGEQTAALLTAYANAAHGARTCALIHAPESEADSFDAMGRFVTERWDSRELSVVEERIIVADRPRDQLSAMIELLAVTGAGPDGATPDDVTVGLGDESMGTRVARTIELCGSAARVASGRPAARTRPVILLASLAEFLQAETFSALAEMIRHPDLERVVRESSPMAFSENSPLTILDRYRGDTLQRSVSGDLRGEYAGGMKEIIDALRRLMPESAAKPRPLSDWCGSIADILRAIYGGIEIDPHGGEGRILARALSTIADELREQVRVSATPDLMPDVTLADAIRFTIARLSSSAIPPDGGAPAVELLGWLELQLDDAPRLIVLGMNEGLIPTGGLSDPFLPDRARSALGLPDSRSRYARDAMILTAILESRSAVTLITGRRSDSGEPLMPSRLLLTGQGDRFVARAARFFGPDRETHRAAPPLFTSSPEIRLRIPLPRGEAPQGAEEKPVDRVRVTSFRSYLACPYRFYLRHVLGLEAAHEEVTEMGASRYGTFLHGLLSEFARSEFAESKDEHEIADFLEKRITESAAVSFGTPPPVPVALQIALSMDRLRAFAQWQSGESRGGWKILASEKEYTMNFDVDGKSILLSGTIDRIDRHVDGRIRVLDYKTAETVKKPDAMHRTGTRSTTGTPSEREWVDLQLPLYRALLRNNGFVGSMALGYVLLPGSVGDVGMFLADWSDVELDDAEAVARRVVRLIRRRVFWPPRGIGHLPSWSDGFEGICMDRYIDRARVIELSMKETS